MIHQFSTLHIVCGASGIVLFTVFVTQAIQCWKNHRHSLPKWQNMRDILRKLPNGSKLYINIIDRHTSRTFLFLRVYAPGGDRSNGPSFSEKHYCYHHKGEGLELEVGTVLVEKEVVGKKVVKLKLRRFWLS